VKWDVDRALAPYEPIVIPGTVWQRVLMQVSQARREGLRVPSKLEDTSVVTVWSLGIGRSEMPKEFIHGFTMRECFLRLRKMVKLKVLVLPKQLYPELFRKPKPKERKRRTEVPRGTERSR
jgi:hypothetical protein